MKTKLIFLLPIFASLLSGCNNSNNSKYTLMYGTYCDIEITQLSYAELKYKMNTSKENMMLAIRPAGYTHCSCWGIFNPILDEFVETYHYTIYFIDYYTLAGQEETWNLPLNQNDPEFAYIENGAVKKAKIYSTTEQFFKNIDSFKKETDAIVNKPNYYYVNDEYLNNKITGKANFNIIYSERNNNESNYLFNNILKPYGNNKNLEDFYVFDFEKLGYLEYPESYQELKDTYKLSNKNSTAFGYDNGFVPTIQNYKNGNLNSAITYLNDSLSLDNDHYTISNSYFTSERAPNLEYVSDVVPNVLKGMNIPSSQVENNKWKYEYAKAYHDPLMGAFLNKYIK